MIIEMANGVKFTIGPNDIQNITFNEGEITISGTGIQQLLEANEQLRTMLEATNDQTVLNTQKTAALAQETEAISVIAATTAESARESAMKIDSLAYELATLMAGGGGNVSPERIDSIVRVLKNHQATIDRVSGYPSWSQVNSQINSYSKEADEARAKLKTAQSDIDALKKTTDTTDKNLSTLTTKVNTINSKVGTLETKMSTVEGKVSTVEGKVSTLETKVSSLDTNKASKDDLNKAVTTLNAAIEKVSSSVTALTTRVAALEKAVEALKKQ
jgi:uncharacterized phage infection (PIP) family protein YhgE